MSSISSSPLMGTYNSSFNYSVMSKRKSNSEQSLFNVSNNNQSDAKQGNIAVPQKSSGQALFEQNLYEAITSANKVVSASATAESTGAAEKEEKGFFDLMLEAIAEAFKTAFEEELEKNGGNAKAALIKAKADVNVNALSDQELSDVLQDIASEYSAKVKNGVNVEENRAILAGLQKEIAVLDKKISMEDIAAKLNADNSDAAETTAKKKPIDKNEVLLEKFTAKLAENGNDLTGAMEFAKEETFKLIFAQELERNGGNVDAAISFASLETGMNSKELIGVLEDLAKEYQVSADIEKALEAAITALDKIIGMEEDASSKLKDKDSNDDKSNDSSNGNNDNIADSLRYVYSQSKESIDYKNNKQNAKLYEAMIAENVSARNRNVSNREALNIMV